MKVLAWIIRAVGLGSAAAWRWVRSQSSGTQVVFAVVVGVLVIGSLPNGSGGTSREVASGGGPADLAPTAERFHTRAADTRASEPRASERTAPSELAAVEVAVASVTDGDTLRLADGRSVRLAQVDAPERGACFGTESTAALRALVDRQSVVLQRPPTGPEKDRYGRTVADVVLAGRSVNQELVEQGAAEWYEQFAHEDVDLAARLRAAEGDAQAAGRGLWSACGTSFAPPAEPPPPPPSAPTRSAGTSGSDCHPSYVRTCIPKDVSDADCAGGSGNGPYYVQESDIGVVGADVFDLDRDGDGVGCES